MRKSNQIIVKTSCFSLWALLFLMFSCKNAEKTTKETKKPNILFILVDDLGYSDVGYMNHKEGLHTPNIDKLAEDGLVFTEAYTAAPVCSPTRASILTGKSPAALKLTCHIPGRDMKGYLERQNKDKHAQEAYFLDHLPLEEETIAEVLKTNGYTTGFFGKWHLAGSGSAFIDNDGMVAPQFHPENQGFDVNIGGCAYGQPKRWFAPFKNATIAEKEEGTYLTDRLGDEAVEFIESNKDTPFLLYFSTYTVHTPLKAPQEIVDKNKGNTYHAMIEKLDQNIGKVINQLEQAQLMDNTMIVFYSDNGGLWGNAPLKDDKGSMHEGGVKVPLIVKWANKIKAGKTKVPVTSVDLFPTLLDVVGVSKEQNSALEGISLWPLLTTGDVPKERPLYWHFPHHRSKGLTMASAIREGDWKLISSFETDSTYLYNLKEDIAEVNNRITQHPEKAKELLQKLKNWQQKVNAEMPKFVQ